jgi:glutamyl-tRNA reductase
LEENMKFACIGLNHYTAAAEIREKAAFSDMKKVEVINYFLDMGIDEVIVLSTCNRSEVYIAGASEGLNIVKQYYAEVLAIRDYEKYLYVKTNEEALYHIFSVASGLDSLVIGEDQILGQVKEAHLLAMSIGSSKKFLNKIFREAVSTAKKIKAALKISQHSLSISYISVKFLKEKLGSLEGKSILMVGLGNMGRLALTYMLEEKVKDIYVTYRNSPKLFDLLKQYPMVKAVNYKCRYKILSQVDILISATSAPHLVIRADEMEKPVKEIFIMDMAIPRDVEDKVSRFDKVHLYNVDDLKSIAALNEKVREKLSEEAKGIITSDLEALQFWLNSSSVDPVIKSLKEKCSIIEADTLDYLYRKLDLNMRDKKIVEKMLSSALKRLIREPILRLKEMEDSGRRNEYARVLNELFHIEGGDVNG